VLWSLAYVVVRRLFELVVLLCRSPGSKELEILVLPTRYQGQSGWFTVGGTSASSPMWAARAAVAGVTVNGGYVYGSSITYRDITSGNNGASCLLGYDLCSGRGSWLG
jgi:hypothetical protein